MCELGWVDERLYQYSMPIRDVESTQEQKAIGFGIAVDTGALKRLDAFDWPRVPSAEVPRFVAIRWSSPFGSPRLGTELRSASWAPFRQALPGPTPA